MLIKTLLNKVEHFKSFVYKAVCFATVYGSEALVVDLVPRSNARPECPECGKLCITYDTRGVRLFEYVPVWKYKVYFRYSPRRVRCSVHGVKVEALPFAYGKEQMTTSYKGYLSRRARRLSWKEVADIFETSWESVYRAVKHVVEYGLANRNLDGLTIALYHTLGQLPEPKSIHRFC